MSEAEKQMPLQVQPLSVLYHPHFEPQFGALRRALLVADAVHSIVPKDSNFRPSIALLKHLETLPSTFIATPPSEDDVNIVSDYWVLSALQNAFDQLSKEPELKTRRARFSSQGDFDEKLVIEGATFLSGAKLTSVVYSELEGHGLIYHARDDGTFLVDERAANLIVSYLAQRMSRRLAVRTLAGVEDSYLLSTACDVYDAFEVNKAAVFASALLRLHMPAQIEEMSHEDYKELRAQYSDLRQGFPTYLEQIQKLYRVDDMQTANEFRRALHDIERRIVSDGERIKRSKLGSSIRKWASYGVGSTLAVGAVLLPEHAVSLTLGAIAIQAIGLADGTRMRGQFDGVRSMMISANDDVLRAVRLPRFLGKDLLTSM